MPSESSEGYYLWQAAGKPLAIRLDYDAMDRLTMDVMRGFGAVRRRGTEVGGILLGRIESGEKITVVITDFQAVPCEYAQGPSYLLSEKDMERFREAVENCSPCPGTQNYVVGFYRSHTRDGLFLDDSDMRLFREYFEESSHVALVIKPFATRPSVAGFFVPERGVLNGSSSSGEFVFRRPQMNGREASRPMPLPLEPVRPEPVKIPIQSAPPPAATAIVPSPITAEAPRSFPITPLPEAAPLFATYQPKPQSPMWRVRLALICFSVTLILFGTVLGFQMAGGKLAPATVSSATDPYAAGLLANRTGDNVALTWDKTSPVVKAAARARLTVSEGALQRTVDLDQSQVLAGSVLYRHIAPEIDFRMELILKDQRSVVESTTFKQ